MSRFMKLAVQVVMVTLALGVVPLAQQTKARPPQSLRLYVFDCGILHFDNADTYSLKKEEVAELNMSVPCYLVAHPKGTVFWDAGIIPDSNFKGGGTVTAGRASSSTALLPQMAAVGYSPSDITYLAMSHYHGDHSANANAFAKSTWLVRKGDRDVMFAEPTPAGVNIANFNLLKNSTTTILTDDEYDVFKDGAVIIKSAPGHTPGHQVLFLKLAKTGPIVLSGDLYHYPEERTLNRMPPRELEGGQTAASRAAVEAFLRKTGAQLWIEHDFKANAKLRKSPQFYE